jgi:hypothetical protein
MLDANAEMVQPYDVSLYEPKPTIWTKLLRGTQEDLLILARLAATYTEYDRALGHKGKWSINDVLLALIRKHGAAELKSLFGTAPVRKYSKNSKKEKQ